MFFFRPAMILLSLLLTAAPLYAAVTPTYNYIGAAALEARLKAGEAIHLLDIQVEEEYAKHHIKGATATHAYPVKSEADTAKLQAAVAKIKADNAPVVIVCPRGAGGATRTYDYLLTQGIAAERLLILEKGQEGWTCVPLTEGK
jgi:rhodanese-related sulfurtransferase